MPRLPSVLLALVALIAIAVGAHAAEGAAVPAHAAGLPPTTAPAASGPTVEGDVELFNPNFYQLDDRGLPQIPMVNPFSRPATEIARNMLDATWFSALVFMPFLILPMVLLLVVIFRFRDLGDGRKPATFAHNFKLEIVWTVIPFLAVLVVSYPTWVVLDYMDSPPPAEKKDKLTITVIGKQFAWDYVYKGNYKDPAAEAKEELRIGQDQGIQEAVVLPKGRTTQLNITSDDVNHAWWIPAFGVKRDAFKGRFTFVWFTPERVGKFKGQCAELCGEGHGKMLIFSSVVEPADFARYLDLLRQRDDTVKVWGLLQPPPGAAVDAKALREAVAGYLAKGRSAERQYALRYWIASNYATLQRVMPAKGQTLAKVVGVANPQASDRAGREREVLEAIKVKRDQLDALLKELVATTGSTERTLAVLPAERASDIKTSEQHQGVTP
jgi:cytochrome c oxidase subunit 2